MIAFLILAIAEPNVISLSVCSSVECMTKPAIELECSIAERDKPWRRLKIVRTGGRAYNVPRTDGGREIGHTPLIWSFQDHDGEFSSFKQSEINPVEVWFRKADGTSLIFTDRYSRLLDFSSIRIDTFNRANEGRDARTMVGLCKTIEKPQSPLSDEERQSPLSDEERQSVLKQ